MSERFETLRDPEEIPQRSVFLEIGPGGQLSMINSAERKLGKHERYIGAEISFADAHFTKVLAEAKQEGSVDLVNADGRMLPFRSGSIDRILFSNVLGGNRPSEAGDASSTRGQTRITKFDWESLVAEAKRVLVPEGEIVINESDTPPPIQEIGTLLKDAGFKVRRQLLAGDPGWAEGVRMYTTGADKFHSPSSYILHAKKTSVQ